MGRREDLEALILKQYEVIREYEIMIMTSDRPEERLRSEDQIETRRTTLYGYLREYLDLCRNRGLPILEEVAEIAVSLGVTSEPERKNGSYSPMPRLTAARGWGGVVGLGIVVLSLALFWSFLPEPAGEPAPMLTATNGTSNAVLLTPLPSAPVFQGSGEYRIAIAPFEMRGPATSVEIAQRLEDDLRLKAMGGPLAGDIEVKVLSYTITSEAMAREWVAQSGCDVLIWGWYDSLGIQVQITLGESARIDVPNGVEMRELGLTIVNDPQEMAFYIHDVLPEHTTFLTLFIVGHLYYLSNHAADGKAAFDAAMTQIPPDFRLENESLLYFFNARLMQTSTFTEPINIICDYAHAIERDPDLVEAYNNLGVFTMQLTDNDPVDPYFNSLEPYEEERCLLKARIASLRPNLLFQQAIDRRPDWGLVQYNLAAYNWNHERARDMRQQFEALVALDPSIPGAHIALGILAIWEEDFPEAEYQFETALGLSPNSPELIFNLGQAQSLAGKDAAAIANYQRALPLMQDDPLAVFEIHLALGNLYHRQGDLKMAEAEYEAAQQVGEVFRNPDNRYSFQVWNVLQVARAKLELDTGHPEAALERLAEGREFSEFNRYMDWLIRAQRANSTAGEERVLEVNSKTGVDALGAWTLGWIDTLTWLQIADRCVGGSEKLKTWRLGDPHCSLDDLSERREYLFDRFQYNLRYWLFFNQRLPGVVS